jgi:hypothetical protein
VVVVNIYFGPILEGVVQDVVAGKLTVGNEAYLPFINPLSTLTVAECVNHPF